MSVDWSRTEEVMHKPLRNTWPPPSVYYFQTHNKRFIEEFIPGGDHDDLQLFMLQGYGAGLEKIHYDRTLFGTIEMIYFHEAYDPLVAKTAGMVHTQDTDIAQQLGYDYALWMFDEHKKKFTNRFSLSETEEEKDKLDYISYGECMNFYYLSEAMLQAHKKHVKQPVLSVTIAA